MNLRTIRSPQIDQWLDRASPGYLLILYVIVTLITTIWGVVKSPQAFNNFTIFRASFRNLANGVNLYQRHRDQYIDLYKYSPTSRS